jgi:hypothetical protein
MTHPLDIVYGPGNVDKAAVIADGKTGYRRNVADNDTVRSTDLSGQTAGIYVQSTRRRYYLDTESVAMDDGENVLIDDAGNHFLYETEGAGELEVEYTDADVVDGVITLSDDVDVALINVTQAVTVQIGAAADHSGRSLTIKDLGGTAASGNIVPAFDGSETCDGLSGAAFAIATNYGWVKFHPVSDGWYQRS